MRRHILFWGLLNILYSWPTSCILQALPLGHLTRGDHEHHEHDHEHRGDDDDDHLCATGWGPVATRALALPRSLARLCTCSSSSSSPSPSLLTSKSSSTLWPHWFWYIIMSLFSFAPRTEPQRAQGQSHTFLWGNIPDPLTPSPPTWTSPSKTWCWSSSGSPRFSLKTHHAWKSRRGACISCTLPHWTVSRDWPGSCIEENDEKQTED